jgi:hypothetical protein
MPCCAFAACIVAQLLLGVRAMKRAIFGQGAGESAARNLAVEWRLDPVAAPSSDLAPAFAAGFLSRRSLRGLALAAALEIVIVLGAIWLCIVQKPTARRTLARRSPQGAFFTQ